MRQPYLKENFGSIWYRLQKAITLAYPPCVLSYQNALFLALKTFLSFSHSCRHDTEERLKVIVGQSKLTKEQKTAFTNVLVSNYSRDGDNYKKLLSLVPTPIRK